MSKKIIKSIIPYYSLLFLSCLTVFSFSTQIVIPNYIDLILKIVCYLLLIRAIFSNRVVKKKELMIIFIFITTAFFSMIVTKSTTLATTIIALLSVNKLDLKRSFRYILTGTILGILTNLMASVMSGAIFDYIYYRNTKRHTLGFNSPNIMGTYVLWISVLLYQLYPAKKTIVVCVIVCGLVFSLTNCRSLAVSGIAFLALLLVSNFRVMKNVLRGVVATIIPILSILIMLIVLNIDSPIGRALDDLFTHRFYLSSLAIQENGFTLIPQAVSDEQSIRLTHDNFTIDIGYVLFFYRNGLVFLVIASVRLFCLVKRQKLDNNEVNAIIVQAIHMLFEVHTINALIGFPLFYIFRSADEKGVKNA